MQITDLEVQSIIQDLRKQDEHARRGNLYDEITGFRDMQKTYYRYKYQPELISDTFEDQTELSEIMR